MEEKRRLEGDLERLRARNALLELQAGPSTSTGHGLALAPPRADLGPPNHVETEDGESTISVCLEWSGDMEWAALETTHRRDAEMDAGAAHQALPNNNEFPPLGSEPRGRKKKKGKKKVKPTLEELYLPIFAPSLRGVQRQLNPLSGAADRMVASTTPSKEAPNTGAARPAASPAKAGAGETTMEERVQTILARILLSILEELRIPPGNGQATGGHTPPAALGSNVGARGVIAAQHRERPVRPSHEMPPPPPPPARSAPYAVGTDGPLEQPWNIVSRAVKKKAAQAVKGATKAPPKNPPAPTEASRKGAGGPKGRKKRGPGKLGSGAPGAGEGKDPQN